MPLSNEAIDLIGRGNALEGMGRHDEAEACYLESIRRMEQTDKLPIGAVYNSLGSNALAAGHSDSAIRYYSRAIEVLSGLKGDALLERAHALFNTARIHATQQDPEALGFARKALDAYTEFPFTPPRDLTDAKALHVVAQAVAGETLQGDTLFDVWESVRAIPLDHLAPWVVREFLGILIPFVTQVRRKEYERVVHELRNWAGEEASAEIMEQSDPGVRLLRRMQRALYGFPEMDGCQ